MIWKLKYNFISINSRDFLWNILNATHLCRDLPFRNNVNEAYFNSYNVNGVYFNISCSRNWGNIPRTMQSYERRCGSVRHQMKTPLALLIATGVSLQWWQEASSTFETFFVLRHNDYSDECGARKILYVPFILPPFLFNEALSECIHLGVVCVYKR